MEKEKGAFMRKELGEGPQAVLRTLREASEEVKAAADLLRSLAGAGVERGFIIGSGTSFHASLYLQHLLNKLTGFHVTAVPASEFAEWRPAKHAKYFIIGYSQSGESSDIVEAFKVAKAAGVKTIAITNTPGSTLARISDACIVTRAGEEKAVAATKTFDVQLAAALMLAYELAGKHTGELERAAEAAERVLRAESEVRSLAERYVKAEHAFSLGKDSAYPIALEAALKLKEAAMVHAEGFAAREFLHGPVQLVDETTPVLAFAPSAEAFKGSLKAFEKIAQYKAPLILVGPGAGGVAGYAAHRVEVQGVEGDAAAIPLVKFAQLFAYHLSVLRGLDPDKPTKLTKVVKY
jgi:glucosamine--fructose-6-phosphate aminotransferase (isomerizing)